MHRKVFGIFSILCFLSLSASSSLARTLFLEWKWKRGEEIHYRESTQISLESTSASLSSKSEIKIERAFSITVLSVSKIGGISLKIQWKTLLVKWDRGYSKGVSFDSRRLRDYESYKKDPLLKSLLDYFKKEVTLKVTPSGRVTSDSSSTPSVLSGLSDWEDFFRLPSRSVEKGTYWDRTDRWDLGETSLEAHSQYSLKGIKKYNNRNCAHIEKKSQLKITPFRSAYKKLKPEVEVSKAQGQKYFDPQDGKVLASDYQANFKVLFQGKMGGKAFSITRTLKMNYKLEKVKI